MVGALVSVCKAEFDIREFVAACGSSKDGTIDRVKSSELAIVRQVGGVVFKHVELRTKD